MFYTKKGDDGKTTRFGCNQRFSKSSRVIGALGDLDELNSFLGLCRAKLGKDKIADLILAVQNDLFIIQAQVAGADKKLSKKSLTDLEKNIAKLEKKLPTIKHFIIPGGGELSAYFDVARAVARRAERRVVAVKESGEIKIGDLTLAYLNRLSSFLYVLARVVNVERGIVEKKPKY